MCMSFWFECRFMSSCLLFEKWNSSKMTMLEPVNDTHTEREGERAQKKFETDYLFFHRLSHTSDKWKLTMTGKLKKNFAHNSFNNDWMVGTGNVYHLWFAKRRTHRPNLAHLFRQTIFFSPHTFLHISSLTILHVPKEEKNEKKNGLVKSWFVFQRHSTLWKFNFGSVVHCVCAV